MMITFLIIAITMSLMSPCYSQEKPLARTEMNLDFETSMYSKLDKPDIWYVGGNGYVLSLDHEVKQHANSSLKIVFEEKHKNAFGIFTGIMPLDSIIGKDIRLTGWIKTENVKDGYAGLWLRVDGEDQVLGFDNMHDRGVLGMSEWTQVSIPMNINSKAKSVYFGGMLIGEGIAWFDNLEIFIEGKKYSDIVLPSLKTELTSKEKKELQKYIYPLRTLEVDGGDVSDLKILDGLIGDSKVVALGEVTHGSSEIFKLKNRIIQYLAANKSFDIFSIEANMPESYKVSEYTVEGKGNPKELIAGMYFWTWNTQEVLDMVEWMKLFNQPKPRITFTGFDMQSYQGTMKMFTDIFKNSEEVRVTLDSLSYLLDNIRKNSKEHRGLLNINEDEHIKIGHKLDIIRTGIKELKFDKFKENWLLQNVRLLEQLVGKSNYFWRDLCMAENLMWIKDQNPFSKIVIWAHNGHIEKGKEKKRMGSYLADSLKQNYLTFGFTFFDGSYTAIGKNGLKSYDAQTAYPTTLEYLLNQMDEPIFILDLKKIKENDSRILQFLTQKIKFRTIGAMQQDEEFYETVVADDFDYLIFIKSSTPSVLLKKSVEETTYLDK